MNEKTMKKTRTLLVIFVFTLSLLSVVPVRGLYDDYATGITYDDRTYGPFEILVPYMEKIGPQVIDPQFAIGPTGTVSVVFTDGSDHAVYYTDNATGSWSTPLHLLEEAHINDEEHAITVDGNGDVHIIADSGYGKYFTNRTGSWIDKDYSFDSFGYNIEYIDAYDTVYIATNDPSEERFIFRNITYNPSYENGSMTIDYDYGFFLDMDVNSTGHAHCVYRGFENIGYFVINPDGTYTTPRNISQTNGEILSYCTWPSIDIDSDNNVHVIYTKNIRDSSNQTIHSASGLFYDVIEETTDGSSAIKVSDHPGGKAYMTTGIGDGKRHIGSYQSFDQITQVEHIINGAVEGEWNETFLTNFSYSLYVQGMSVRDIEINPITNEPVILSTYRGHMELSSMHGGKWGTMVEFKAELDTLQATYPDNLQLTMEITNLDESSRNFATFAQVFGLADIEFGNPEGNQQAVGVLAADEKITLNWELHYTGKFEGQLHASFLANADIDDRGYAGVYWEIGISLDIPGYSLWILGLISIIAVSLFVKKYKK